MSIPIGQDPWGEDLNSQLDYFSSAIVNMAQDIGDWSAFSMGLQDRIVAIESAMAGMQTQLDDHAARIAALESESSGGGDGPSILGNWQANNQPGALPGGQQVSSDTGNIDSASFLRFAKFDKSNTDMSTVLLNAKTFYCQQQSDASRWARGEITEASDDGGFITVLVSNVVSGGDGGAAWQTISFVFRLT